MAADALGFHVAIGRQGADNKVTYDFVEVTLVVNRIKMMSTEKKNTRALVNNIALLEM